MATTKPLVIVMMMTNLPVDWCLSFMVMVKVIDQMGRGSGSLVMLVIWVMGQVSNGSHESWVTLSDPLTALIGSVVSAESCVIRPTLRTKSFCLLYIVT